MTAGALAPAADGADDADRVLDTLPGTVAIDARAVHASGIGRYLRELLDAWLRQPPFERLVLLGDPAALAPWRDAPATPRVEVVSHQGGFYAAAAQRSWLAVRREACVREARASFFPHWDAPLLALPRRSTVVVHDLTHLRVRDAFPATKRVAAAVVLRRVVARAARIVCVSHATADDVADEFPGTRSRLRVVHNGVTARFAGHAGAPPLDGPYLLAVGNQKPHKNLAAAVGVLARLRAGGASDMRLLVAGREFAAQDAVQTIARAAGVGDAVVALGEVNDDALHAAYAGCSAFLFPSRHEGFGLPLLEAMLAGAPVVASSAPAVAEVVGDAAPTFAPDDVEGMSAAVRALLADPALRAGAVARGRARARAFTWERAARETGRVLHEAAGVLSAPTGSVNLDG